MLALVALFFVYAGLARASVEDLPPSIIGTYNTTFAIVEVSSDVIQGLVPASYSGSILPPDSAKFPGLEDGLYPLFLELGREANAGPPLLNFVNFQEAKIEVPYVQRLEGNASPFLYKRWIAVDSTINAIGSAVQFGLNASKEVFVPVNTSDSTNFDYTIVGAVEATFEPVDAAAVYPLSTFHEIGGLPWFAEYLTCAQHFYDWESAPPVTHLNGSVTLHPPYVPETTTFAAKAVNGVFSFEIVGPLICDFFV